MPLLFFRICGRWLHTRDAQDSTVLKVSVRNTLNQDLETAKISHRELLRGVGSYSANRAVGRGSASTSATASVGLATSTVGGASRASRVSSLNIRINPIALAAAALSGTSISAPGGTAASASASAASSASASAGAGEGGGEEDVASGPTGRHWGWQWHMQTPLENIPAGSFVLIEVLYSSSSAGAGGDNSSGGGGGCCCWTSFPLELESVDSGPDCAPLMDYPLPTAVADLAHLSRAVPGDNRLSFGVVLSKRARAMDRETVMQV
jgi:hypothetical protein